MSTQTIRLTDAIQSYLVDVTVREPEVFRRLRAETARLENRNMQIAPEQGQFMALLVELLGARRALEIGTFTGYSALWIASALPPDGRLLCCDVNDQWTRVARRYWAEAGLADRMELRLAPALDTLDGLLAGGQAGTFDFAFIDADKPNYDNYYERVLRLLRPGGLAALDNALNNGRVVDPAAHPDTHAAIHDAMNRKIRGDPRVSMSLVPIGDGLMLVRKRSG
ncbi:MAG: class I SAM-dependent methyltransferase [Planctomycetota bacterium]